MTAPLRDLLAASLDEGAAKSILAYAEEGETPLDRFLDGVGHLCPFLGRIMRRSPARLERVLDATPEGEFPALMPDPASGELPLEELKSYLRNARNDIALAVALGDLCGVLTLSEVTECLTVLGDKAIALALEGGARAASELRGVEFEEEPTLHHGLSIIAMGKLGARELNYSSDIDLVAIYDPSRAGLSPDSRLDAKAVAIKTVQIMVDILNQQTVEGFVFRTDLRLRPNPGATNVAVSLSAAERYYEEYGQNWERAAFIKARACAGDQKTGETFMRLIRPFVWRRTLDFGAVADIHAVKKQIHAEKGRPDLEVPGADVKLGPGGIREIEFFAQTQQLLLGGRDKSLRSPRTEEALFALAKDGHIDEATAEDLCKAYQHLRATEHRLQMREDAQTQELPEDEEGLSRIAALMNAPGRDEFVNETEAHMRLVHDAYADLFDTPEPHEPVPGSLVFTGVEDDPRTLQTLRNIGFEAPEVVTDKIRRWHMGALRATKSARARELLTGLVPRILMQLGELASPDQGFLALDSLLTRLPAGFQVFSLFTAEPEILDDVLVLCQASPEFTRKFGERPALIEGLLEGVDITPPDPPYAPEDADMEERLDAVRRVINEHRIRTSAGLVLGQTSPIATARALSDAADGAIEDLTAAVRQEAEAAGKAPLGELAVLGFGRLGIEALTTLSDLDLVFIYDLEEKSHEGEQLFARLVRRIVSALSVPTQQGELFKIDMQLRPSGGAGPTAVSFSAYEQYYTETAWTWEMMAFTKARVVYGDEGISQRIEAVQKQVLTRPRDPAEIAKDVIDMRARLLAEKAPRTLYDVKRLPGGLTDIDFITQYLSLIHAEHLGLLPRHPRDAINTFCQHGILTEEQAEILLDAHELVECTIHYLRATEGGAPPESLLSGAHSRLRKLSDLWDDSPLDEQLTTHRRAVKALFDELVGPYSAEI
ncbi:bifunctional [glutamine synthetase] adenylyltransferase/[glutamine synthetase]-adenylyl-L-tyrosine phosphorylase [Parvularcula marina]|uniref:Bifunctional [glutamine synthetase] adenylyltransferase/[glutamine synthetase]-adenylyl-L-tyrosine phosphorylase n=1 Tax=Parvularcula marina TaxID=2292771 RepID=A0A371RKI1_9PROT|nr:bifunctional [glutamine synthetase] adenylyltransferase/[glutamine synthetase]-adenylyl-L-tyrosine phosphorylase [Parvularcula marina]RFB05944.1 bifunctional [glutamine synthetase] adenylyltransferase/[glutamine synthetase]-adenylyl-L-tyrosine phosphorylase [Parvularcula marina]